MAPGNPETRFLATCQFSARGGALIVVAGILGKDERFDEKISLECWKEARDRCVWRLQGTTFFFFFNANNRGMDPKWRINIEILL